jgi:L,D-transpeptidase-like protein
MQQKTWNRLVQVAIFVFSVFAFTSKANAFSVESYFSETMENRLAITAASETVTASFFESRKSIYDSLQLESIGLQRKIFEYGLKGMEKLIRYGKVQANILSIADLSQPSTNKRLYVIDLDNQLLLFNSLVAHGRRSGKDMATVFSNKMSSNKTSLGFYLTGNTYNGSNGYSLKLQGLEYGINNNAMRRAIVVHGADYVSDGFAEGHNQSYIGRSQGCPAVPTDIAEPLIDGIKDGTCLFIYYPTSTYLKKSALLR